MPDHLLKLGRWGSNNIFVPRTRHGARDIQDLLHIAKYCFLESTEAEWHIGKISTICVPRPIFKVSGFVGVDVPSGTNSLDTAFTYATDHGLELLRHAVVVSDEGQTSDLAS